MLDILEISDLSLHLTQTGRPLLEHFSFTLGAGDRAVLIGEEGNGKSTLLRYLAQPEALKGYCEAEGRVTLRGRPGYLPQLLPEAGAARPAAGACRLGAPDAHAFRR